MKEKVGDGKLIIISTTVSGINDRIKFYRFPVLGCEPVGGITTEVCGAWTRATWLVTLSTRHFCVALNAGTLYANMMS